MARRLPALCGGGRAATMRVRRKLGVQRPTATTYSSPSANKLIRPAAAAAAAAPLPGGGKTKKSSCGPGGGCYVVNNNNNGNGGELMVEVGGAGAGGRRVMVVADGRAEAAGALQWALSQAVRSNDTLVLLAVVKPPPLAAQLQVSESCVNMLGTKSQQHLAALRTVCESTRPEVNDEQDAGSMMGLLAVDHVKVETCAVEAEERAPAVVEAARRHGASLLVLGQRRRRAAVARWLQALWRRRRRCAGSTVEYCIEHAPCVALAVRRRSSGGYLVSSKRHKDFWLLA